jgi:hypothetical protein
MCDLCRNSGLQIVCIICVATMAESDNKVSFVFSKVSKPPSSLQQIKHKAKEDVQYIDCLDNNAIVFKKYVLLLWLCIKANIHFINDKYCIVSL